MLCCMEGRLLLRGDAELRSPTLVPLPVMIRAMLRVRVASYSYPENSCPQALSKARAWTSDI